MTKHLLALILFLSPLGIRAAEPGNAAEALCAHRWDFHGKTNSGELVFHPDGRVDVAWEEREPWRWTSGNSPRDFEIELEFKGKRRTMKLSFNDDFTAFSGPGLREGFTVRGTRGAALAPPAPAPSATPTPGPTPDPTPSATPKKSALDVIAENGPFLTDQVLAPLDQPSVSEAEVALWREDLLDEAAQAPAARQSAYRQAVALVDAWKAALRERYQVLSTAGLSGAASDGPDMASGRKTVLHVWDWLEYARERDAAARHERRQQRTAEFFASGPPRRWAERSAALRQNIDRLYVAFRQALRGPTPTAP
jgi:hypothetical protein